MPQTKPWNGPAAMKQRQPYLLLVKFPGSPQEMRILRSQPWMGVKQLSVR
nr:MAG TPA: hypothetical protein [Caudoviricetes sp.]DAQ59217.1 MAG TPA: hypothetical protein [Caudoviricetes sp.]